MEDRRGIHPRRSRSILISPFIVSYAAWPSQGGAGGIALLSDPATAFASISEPSFLMWCAVGGCAVFKRTRRRSDRVIQALQNCTWADFAKAHAKSLWQCDFFSKHVVTADGVIGQCFILAFVHIYSRRAWLSPCTFKPDAAWMKEQADAFLSHAKAQNLPVEIVLRDRDSKYTGAAFDDKLEAAGVRVTKVGYRAPK
jgi:hypothetical protein